MKISFLGFSIKNSTKNTTQQDFYEMLVRNSGASFKVGEHDRYIYFNDEAVDGFLVGLVLTLKDQKRFCKADVQRGSFTVNTEDVVGGKLADFNFFVIDKETSKGMFQYYHQSCSAQAFGAACKHIHGKEKEILVSSELSELIANGFGDNESTRKKAMRKYSGRLKFNVLIDSREIDQIISSFESISDLSVTFEAPFAPIVDGEAEKSISDSVKIQYSISPDRQPSDVVDSVRKMLNMRGFKRGSAKGVSLEGEDERTINLLRVPHDFGVEDFDEYAGLVNELDDSNFQENEIINRLVSKVQSREYANVFGTP